MIQHNETTTIQFGAMLHKALKEARISRQFLADYLQCSEDAVDSWCCGRARVSPERLNSICSLLSTKGRLSTPQVRQLYQQALESYGFAPNWPPGNAVKLREITLCITGSLFRRKELMATEIISSYLGRLNQQVFIFHCGNDVNMVLSCLNMVDALGIANLVLCGMTLPSAVYALVLDEMAKHNTPVTMIASDCPRELVYAHKNCFAAGWSNYDLAYRATRVLIEAGHERIGTVNVIRHTARFRGYSRAMQDSGLTVSQDLVLNQVAEDNVAPPSIADPSLMRPLEQYLVRANISAIFAPSELLTLAIPILLLKAGKQLYDDISFCGLAYPGWIGQELNMPLTFFSYPIEEVTHKALDIIMRRSVLNELSQEERFVDVTRLAKRIDTGKRGSIKPVAVAASP